jgi:hypothetical protein
METQIWRVQSWACMNFSYLRTQYLTSSRPSQASLHPHRVVTQERGTSWGSQQNARRPLSAWHKAQHEFLSTRERRQIFVGTRFRNSGIYWNWAKY